jgi:integrase/recombinase XerD
VGDVVVVPKSVAKKGSGGEIPMATELRAALVALHAGRKCASDEFVVRSERGAGMTAHGVVQWFRRRFAELGFEGASSHSGRRTFITTCARKASLAGGSMKDVMVLARHRSLSVTTAYVVSEEGARRKLVALI